MSLDYRYIMVSLIPEQTQELYDKLISIGLSPAYKYEPHCTVIYNTEELEEPLCELDPKKVFKAHVTSIDFLGKDDLVFHLTSRDIVDEFHRLTDYGYEHSFETPLPHMTLLYDSDPFEKLMIEEGLKDWVGKELTFTKEQFGFKK